MAKNIIIVNDTCKIDGGAAKVAIDSANALTQLGYQIYFVTALNIEPDIKLKHPKIEIINLGEKSFLNQPKWIACFSGLFSIRIGFRFFNFLIKFDRRETIIHVHSWTKALSNSIFCSIIILRFRYLITLHDYFTICPNGGLFNFQLNKPCKLNPMSVKCLLSNCDSRSYKIKLWRYLRQLIFIFLRIDKSASALISISEASEIIFRNNLVSDKIYRISNPHTRLHKHFSILDSRKYVLYIGRLAHEKGVLQLADVCHDLNLICIFIGDGVLKEQLQQDYPNNIYTGWLSHEEMKSFIDKSRVLVFPSLWPETEGLVVLEAMSVGIACMVSSYTAARSYIKHGVNGFKFDPLDKKDFSLTLKDIFCNPLIDLKKISDNAYSYYKENSTSSRSHAKQLVHLYQKVLD